MPDAAEIVTVTDVRRTGHCAAGVRRWCVLNGLDFRAFIKNGGIRVDQLPPDDPFVVQVLKLKRGGDGRRR